MQHMVPSFTKTAGMPAPEIRAMVTDENVVLKANRTKYFTRAIKGLLELWKVVFRLKMKFVAVAITTAITFAETTSWVSRLRISWNRISSSRAVDTPTARYFRTWIFAAQDICMSLTPCF